MIDHSKCRASTGIDDTITAGQGKLDENGFWEIPCPECELKFSRLLDNSRHDNSLMDEIERSIEFDRMSAEISKHLSEEGRHD